MPYIPIYPSNMFIISLETPSFSCVIEPRLRLLIRSFFGGTFEGGHHSIGGLAFRGSRRVKASILRNAKAS